MSPEAATTERDLWTRTFEEIERNLADVGPAADQETVDRISAWRPPAELGPLPAELYDRARELAAELVRCVAAMREQMKANRRHQQVATAVPPARPQGISAYLDVEA